MTTNCRVEIAASAQRDIRTVHSLIALDRPKAADKWVREFHRHARSLRSMPLRYEIIPEAEDLGVTYRPIIFGNYRIITRWMDGASLFGALFTRPG